MAEVQAIGEALAIAPRSDAEEALLCHGCKHGGRIVLLDGYYTTDGRVLLLPQQATLGTAQRVLRAFEHAAAAHQQARSRRRRFRLVE